MMADNVYGRGLFSSELSYHYGAERLGCGLVSVSGGVTSRQVQLICDFPVVHRDAAHDGDLVRSIECRHVGGKLSLARLTIPARACEMA
jgi:hypothetical protein